MKKIFFILYTTILIFHTNIFCAHPLTIDDAPTVSANSYELEVGYDNIKDQKDLRNHSSGITLKHGITEKMDIGLSIPYRIEPKSIESLGKATLGFKFLLIKEIFSISVNNELGSKEYFLNSIVSKSFNIINLHFNLGYYGTGDETVAGKTIYGLAFEYPKGTIDFVGEIIAENSELQNWLFGVRYKIQKMIHINLAYSNSFRDSVDKIVFGFHFEF